MNAIVGTWTKSGNIGKKSAMMDMPHNASDQPARRRVLIVGGGTAGWMTAAFLAKHLGHEAHGGPRITVLESPDIGIVGVGEGTFPTIRNILRSLGIDEARFMRESHATFKQGIRFDDWVTAPKDGVHSHYVHPFEQPYWAREEVNLLPYWLLSDPATRPPLAEAVTFQTRVADEHLGPKRIHQGNYDGPLNYAYHFDAARFAALLAKFAQELGVHHLSGTMTGAVLNDDGGIGHVVSAEHGTLDADLYVDCTGFRAELIGHTLNAPFHGVQNILFNDRSLVTQAPYPRPDTPLESYTIATAHEAGWTWDIGLKARRGIGYVYSSAHTSDDRAEEVLRGYLGGDIETRRIDFSAGYRPRQWVKNCVAVGLSAGFLEPLESTGMVLIESAVNTIVEFFAFHGPIDASADIFNGLMAKRYESIISFLKLHYCLSQRDEPYWVDNRREETIPDRLRDLLKLWKYRPPSRFDFVIDHESFAYFNYQYVLYGMGFETDYHAARGSLTQGELAEHLFARVAAFGKRATQDLTAHRALIDAIYRDGFIDPSAPLSVVK